MKWKQQHSLKGKIVLTTSIVIFLTVFIISSIAIYNLNVQARKNLTDFQEEQRVQIDTTLYNYIDLVYNMVQKKYERFYDIEFLQKSYGAKLKSNIEIVDNLIAKKQEKAQNATDTVLIKSIQRETIDLIKALRYDEGTGYFWINDTGYPYPKMVMHPTKPELDGQLLDSPNYNVAMGKQQNLFQAMVEVCRAKGEGYVNYVWPKPSPKGLIPNVPKLSYVKQVTDWQWIVGNGIYLDDVETDIVKEIKETITAMSKPSLDGFFWITDNTMPKPRVMLWPVSNVEGTQGLIDTLNYTSAFNRMAQLAQTRGAAYVNHTLYPDRADQASDSILIRIHGRVFKPLNWIISTSASLNPMYETIAAKRTETYQKITQMSWIILGVAVAILAIGIFLATYFSQMLTDRIIQVQDRLKNLSQGKSVAKVKIQGKDEVGDMMGSLNDLVDGVDTYMKFAKEIGKGNLEHAFKALSEEDVLGSELIKMRDNLKAANLNDEKRNWITNGLAQFGDILRKNSDNIENLGNELLSSLARYLQISQAALYLARDKGEGDAEGKGRDPYLEMIACYAYDRRKFMKRAINFGEGLLGQVALEKKYAYFTKLPENFLIINSGLGSGNPQVLLISPLVHDEETCGILELASFKEIPDYKMEFVEKLSLSIASTIASVRANAQTKFLLEQSQKLGEELRLQEEELRQNQEEMQASNEQLKRDIDRLNMEKTELQNVLDNMEDSQEEVDTLLPPPPNQSKKNGNGNGAVEH